MVILLGGAPAGPEAEPGWPGEPPATLRRVLSFDDLDGWAEDDHEAALAAFRETCPDLEGPNWPGVCALAFDLPPGAARAFFEALFRPVVAEDGAALLTGYYEPELMGSRRRTARFRVPLHRRPPEVPEGRPWLTRREIERGGALRGRGLEIAWVEDPVDALFLGIQGSGRVRLEEGGTLRLGYGGFNGHARRSIGAEMVRRGILEPGGASAAAIRGWVREHPRRGRELLRHDPSYVFFREVTGLSDDRGPLGAMLRPVTAGRSAAVDPAHVPLGAPVWVEKDGAEPLRRLMVAQDTGSAIRGPGRADLFYGTGAAAGRRAGRVRDPGRIVMLLPIRMAHAMAPDPLGERLSEEEPAADAPAPVAAAPAAPTASAAVAVAPERSPMPRARPDPSGMGVAGSPSLLADRSVPGIASPAARPTDLGGPP